MANDLPRTTLEQWATLLAVTEHDNFEQAAEALNRSQSSVSYVLKKLQEQLPVEVLAPQGRRTALTDSGALLLQRARSVLEEMRRLEHFAATLAQGWEPEVRLSVEIATPAQVVLNALADFSAFAPQTRVQIIESVLSGTSETLVLHQADLAITSMIPPGFIGDPLLQMEFVAVVRHDHPLLQLGHTLTQDDLRHHRQVVIRDTGRYRQVDGGWLGADQRWTVSHLDTALAIIERGLAFAWMPRDLVQPALERGQLRTLPLLNGAIQRETLYLVIADGSDAGPATRALAERLVEQARARDRAAGGNQAEE